ncbi:hypothetical protein MIR68_008182 [Amoeboaphelidium protococcarum]|nr:hypothetical protein MIR68_008182 [Amoeboaphelidium protococcarum]
MASEYCMGLTRLTNQKCVELDAFDKSALIAYIKICSTSLSSAQRLLYICLNVWHEEGIRLPDLSHQEYVASMLEFLCNPQFPHDRQSFHTQLLGDALGPAVLEQSHHASLAGPNPNLYEFDARRVMQTVRWHLTTTLFVYQKLILQAQLEPLGITGRKLTLYIALLNALKFDNPSEALQLDHPQVLLLDRQVKVSLSAEHDADDQDHQEESDATKWLEVPSFSIFPMGADVPRYDPQLTINLKKTRLWKIAADVDEVTLLSDGCGCSIAVNVKDRPWQYANMKRDMESKRQTDVFGKLYDAVYLTDAQNLAERMEGAQVFGVDPGKKNPMLV